MAKKKTKAKRSPKQKLRTLTVKLNSKDSKIYDDLLPVLNCKRLADVARIAARKYPELMKEIEENRLMIRGLQQLVHEYSKHGGDLSRAIKFYQELQDPKSKRKKEIDKIMVPQVDPDDDIDYDAEDDDYWRDELEG